MKMFFFIQVGKSSGEIGGIDEPFLNGTNGSSESYSVLATILP